MADESKLTRSEGDPDSPDGVEIEVRGDFIVYQTVDGRTRVELRPVDGTVWMTQAQMAALFDTSSQSVSRHIKNIYTEQELETDPTIKEFVQVRSEGERQVERAIRYYSLDVVLAVGYRVRSPRGAQFRRWASTILREFLIKGFAIDDERLKDPGGLDYFDELLERIRDIRTSEKRFYQKVRDIFSTAVDYDSGAAVAKTFFATVQNKMTYSVTGETAAELIIRRADPDSPNMGLTAWSGGRVRKGDVVIAKNYLSHEEVQELNRISSALLDLAEDRAKRRRQTTMADWVQFVDDYLTFTGRDVLENAGSVSRKSMETEVGLRYDSFDDARRQRLAEEAEKDHFAEIEHLRESGKGLEPPSSPGH